MVTFTLGPIGEDCSILHLSLEVNTGTIKFSTNWKTNTYNPYLSLQASIQSVTPLGWVLPSCSVFSLCILDPVDSVTSVWIQIWTADGDSFSVLMTAIRLCISKIIFTKISKSSGKEIMSLSYQIQLVNVFSHNFQICIAVHHNFAHLGCCGKKRNNYQQNSVPHVKIINKTIIVFEDFSHCICFHFRVTVFVNCTSTFLQTQNPVKTFSIIIHEQLTGSQFIWYQLLFNPLHNKPF